MKSNQKKLSIALALVLVAGVIVAVQAFGGNGLPYGNPTEAESKQACAVVEQLLAAARQKDQNAFMACWQEKPSKEQLQLLWTLIGGKTDGAFEYLDCCRIKETGRLVLSGVFTGGGSLATVELAPGKDGRWLIASIKE